MRQFGLLDSMECMIKKKLFRYRRVSKVNLYSINEFEDYYYGYMLYSTGYLKYFKYIGMMKGLYFRCQRLISRRPCTFSGENKVLSGHERICEMGDIQEIETVGGLNRNITSGDVQETVLVQEAMQERRIARN